MSASCGDVHGASTRVPQQRRVADNVRIAREVVAGLWMPEVHAREAPELKQDLFRLMLMTGTRHARRRYRADIEGIVTKWRAKDREALARILRWDRETGRLGRLSVDDLFNDPDLEWVVTAAAEVEFDE